MRLTLTEKKLIDIFKKKVKDRFGDDTIKIILFGSKARGDAKEDSDIDILVVTSFDDWRKGDEIGEIGHKLEEQIDYRLSILVIPESHFNYLKENNFQFIRNVETEGIAI